MYTMYLYYSVVYLLLAFAFFFIFYFIFIIFNSYFPDTIFFLLYSMVTQLHILFLHITMLHHKWLDIVPSATQQDLIANPFQRQEFASVNPKLPIHPTPSPLATQVYSSSPWFSFPWKGSFVPYIRFQI